MGWSVVTAPSTIEGAGTGLFLRADADGASLATGGVVAWYAGELMSVQRYFGLDAAGDRRVDYAYALKGTEWAVVPVTASLDASAIAIPESEVVHSRTVGCAKANRYVGHFANDWRSVQLPTEREGPLEAVVSEFGAKLEAYLADDAPGPTFIEAAVDFEWRNNDSALADLRDGEAVAFPVVLANDACVSAGAALEIVLGYGAPYWCSRAISPLFWCNEGDTDRPLARLLLQQCRASLPPGSLASLPVLPPHVAIAREANGVRLVNAETKARLSSAELRLVALAMFNRDPAVFRLPENGLTKLIMIAIARQTQEP
jgi:hypothetical protein